jgi:membrane-bound lytic murein transglycosylase C
VLKQWEDYHESTTKTWVDYNDSADAMSSVDFEKGVVEIDVLVPADKKDQVKEIAEKKIAAQTKALLAETDGEAPILKDQVKSPEGKAVTPKSAEKFVHEKLAPSMVVEEKPVVGEDGVSRLKVRVEIPLVPDHLKVRAKRYEPLVTEAARKYDLDPALLFAVIQTESEFNPRARSQAPAFGLMQLMPQSGAREAYQYLYKKDELVTPEYLYEPDNNVMLGATYLHLLKTRHFPKIKKPDNQQTLMIAAYNCGPGCVRKNVLSKTDVDTLDNPALVKVIRKETPRETQEYVPRVQSRIESFRKL